MSLKNWSIIGLLVFALFMVAMAKAARARDVGQWENNEISHWFRSLMQPDHPTTSCCGEADAYWADTLIVDGDKVFAVITDDRPNEPLGRMPVPVGTKIEVPPHKLKWDKGNPTGHAIIFLSRTLDVYCFVQNGGV